MNNKLITEVLKATIKKIIVAFIYILTICILVYILFGNEISKAISLINRISVNTSQNIVEEMKIDLDTNHIINYPEYGSQYGRMIIESINVDLPLYFGDTLTILKKGIGHSSGSYFPGEGGSILCMGHSYKGYIRSLPQVNIGDKIEITTSYGDFTYEIYDTKIIKETDLDAVPIQKEEEILMLYTCYPVDTIGHPTKRFVVYAKPIS